MEADGNWSDHSTIDDRLLSDIEKECNDVIHSESPLQEIDIDVNAIKAINGINGFSGSSRSESLRDMKRMAIFSLPVASKPILLPYNAQRSLIASALLSHKWFSKGYIVETRETGVLYPVIHFLELPDDEQLEKVSLMDRWELGKGLLIYQALYVELSRMDTPVIVSPDSPDANSSQAFIVIGIKTLDQTFNRTFEDNWKDLSGARNIYLNLSSDYGLCEIVLYRRIRPQDFTSFVYILLVKLNNVTIGNHVFLLDFVHRLRLRMLGYISLYGHVVEKTAVLNFDYFP